MSEEVKNTEVKTEVTPVTPEAIAAAVTAGMMAHQAQVESAPKEMTPEERAAYLQVFDPNADGFLDSFVGAITDSEATPETRAKALEHLRDGLVNQSVRGAQLLIQQEIGKLRQEIAPVLVESEQHQAEKLWKQFSEKHKDLADHRELVDAISVQLQAQGFKPKSLDEAFDRAAEVTRIMVKKLTGKDPVAPTATQTAPGMMPRMSTTNTSTSTGNPGSTGNQPQSGVASFFAKRGR